MTTLVSLPLGPAHDLSADPDPASDSRCGFAPSDKSRVRLCHITADYLLIMYASGYNINVVHYVEIISCVFRDSLPPPKFRFYLRGRRILGVWRGEPRAFDCNP